MHHETRMSRLLRILCGLALPPLFAALTMWAYVGLYYGQWINLIKDCLILLVLAYAFTIIPSILSLIAFEWVHSRQLINGKVKTLLFVISLGFLSGCTIAAGLAGMSGEFNNKELLVYLPLGACVGFLMGLVYLLIDLLTAGRK
jgi:hypothetical protein